MWTRIANTSSYSAISRSFQQKHANTALLPCLFESILRRADRDSPSSSFHVHPSMMIARQKHSQTQIKRLFKRNPARLRVEKRMWNIDRTQPKVLLPTDHDTNTASTAPSELTTSTIPVMDSTCTNTAIDQQLSEDVTATLQLDGSHAESATPPSLLYPLVYTIPTILPNGWFPPMDPTLRPNYPFSVRRTKNKPKDSVGFLPIYTKYRKDGTKVVTRIKNVSGDINIFLRELRIVLSLPEPANQLQSYDDIRLRAGNMIEIQNHRAKEIRRWLGGLGF